MRCYLITARNQAGSLLQISVDEDESNAEMINAIKCSLTPRARKFWCAYLTDYGVEHVSNVKQIAGHVCV